MCIKSPCIQSCSHILSRFNWCCKIQLCYDEYLGKLMQLEHLHSEIPDAAPWLPILVIHIRSQVKTRQSQVTNFKKFAKNWNFEIWQEALHATHLLKLLGKMYKYEMDPTRTVGATEWTCDAGQMRDGRTSLSMKKLTTWCKSGRVILVSCSCLYKTQPERALAHVCHTRIDVLSPDEYQFHLLLHRNSHHSQATYPKW